MLRARLKPFRTLHPREPEHEGAANKGKVGNNQPPLGCAWLIVTRRKALGIAVRNNETEQRFSGLLSCLRMN